MSPAAGKVQPVDVARVLHGSVPPTVLLARQRSMQLSPTPCMPRLDRTGCSNWIPQNASHEAPLRPPPALLMTSAALAMSLSWPPPAWMDCPSTRILAGPTITLCLFRVAREGLMSRAGAQRSAQHALSAACQRAAAALRRQTCTACGS